MFVVPFAANASVYTRPLVVGSSGADVSALQQILHRQGYLSVFPSGYLGPLTPARASVITRLLSELFLGDAYWASRDLLLCSLLPTKSHDIQV